MNSNLLSSAYATANTSFKTANLTTPSLLPPTTNPWLADAGDGDLLAALYTPTLLLASGIFQNTLFFSLLLLFRGFSPSRTLDHHLLSVIFGVTLAVAPLVFLANTRLDGPKLWFFLEHAAVEILIAVRVLAPGLARKRPAGVLLACWITVTGITVVVSFNSEYHHGAEIIAWGAFLSDFLVAFAGSFFGVRWLRFRRGKRQATKLPLAEEGLWLSSLQNSRAEALRARKVGAEALAGVGLAIHGCGTMGLAPILQQVVYNRLNPIWLAQRTLPGEAAWTWDMEREFGPRGGGYGAERVELKKPMDRRMMASPGIASSIATVRRFGNVAAAETGRPTSMHWTKLAEKYADEMSSPRYSKWDLVD
ncbi:hypothetical protein K402DRAFT_425455 [Aulographum hederae CBS 113979]|uniref:Uncharacterized protein n=1 Tax=Aulographum hederae CBS 113979 TaxID=1176131 RepID=A0A6G1GKR1_9PEZI|nr:hypothetical protein K402DRAFT_425455 [Aulographum hederae CBS 113979]